MGSQRTIDTLEEIDRLNLDAGLYKKVFEELSTLNQFLGNDFLIKNAFLKVLKQLDTTTEICVVDLGCGNGHHLIKLARACHQLGIKARFIGFDFNPHLIKWATEASIDYINIEFITSDVLLDEFKIPTCDVLISSQFLYHFKNDALLKMLDRNKQHVKSAMIISELNRRKIWSILFGFFGRLFRLNPVTINDGCTAISKSWNKKELIYLLKKSQVFRTIIANAFVFRYIIIAQF